MASEQLLYNGSWGTAYADYEFPLGDDRELVFSHQLGAAGNIQEARIELELNGVPVFQKTLADHPELWDFATPGSGKFHFLAAGTAGLGASTYDLAVEIVTMAGLVNTPIIGRLTLRPGVVDDDASAAYLSWTTLDVFNSQMDILLNDHDAALVAEAAASGATVVVVNNPAPFSVGDTVSVQLGLGALTYQSVEIDSISGDELTLVDALTAAVDAGCIVQLEAA